MKSSPVTNSRLSSRVVSVCLAVAAFAGSAFAVPSPATHFSVSIFSQVPPALAVYATVTALDASNQVVPGYNGTVHIGSTLGATLPSDHTFTATDAGVRAFPITFTATGVAMISATDTATAITGSASTTVVCPAPPPLAIGFIPLPPQVCAGSSGNRAALQAGSAASFQWSITGGSIDAGQGTNAILYTAGASGTVTLMVTTFNTFGCITGGRFGTTEIAAPPTASLPPAIQACAGQASILPFSLTGTAPWSVIWSDGLAQTNITSADTSRSITLTSPATLNILAVSDAACSGAPPSSGVDVTLASTPAIDSQPESVRIHSGESALLKVQASGTDIRYQWYQGTRGDESQSVGTNDSEYTTPALRQTTSYWVKVTNACGSVSSDTAAVSIAAPRRRATTD